MCCFLFQLDYFGFLPPVTVVWLLTVTIWDSLSYYTERRAPRRVWFDQTRKCPRNNGRQAFKLKLADLICLVMSGHVCLFVWLCQKIVCLLFGCFKRHEFVCFVNVRGHVLVWSLFTNQNMLNYFCLMTAKFCDIKTITGNGLYAPLSLASWNFTINFQNQISFCLVKRSALQVNTYFSSCIHHVFLIRKCGFSPANPGGTKKLSRCSTIHNGVTNVFDIIIIIKLFSAILWSLYCNSLFVPQDYQEKPKIFSIPEYLLFEYKHCFSYTVLKCYVSKMFGINPQDQSLKERERKKTRIIKLNPHVIMLIFLSEVESRTYSFCDLFIVNCCRHRSIKAVLCCHKCNFI